MAHAASLSHATILSTRRLTVTDDTGYARRMVRGGERWAHAQSRDMPQTPMIMSTRTHPTTVARYP